MVQPSPPPPRPKAQRHELAQLPAEAAPAAARRYDLDADLLLESVELVAYADPVPADGPCIFTGRAAIYVGDDDSFDDGKGHLLMRDLPMGVCDKTAEALSALGREDLTITASTWHYAGDGCC